MRRILAEVLDWSWCYLMAWLLILNSPIWLPIWLAAKVKKQAILNAEPWAASPERKGDRWNMN